MDARGPRALRNWTFGFSLREAVCHPAIALETRWIYIYIFYKCTVGCCVANEGVCLSTVLDVFSLVFICILMVSVTVQVTAFWDFFFIVAASLLKNKNSV